MKRILFLILAIFFFLASSFGLSITFLKDTARDTGEWKSAHLVKRYKKNHRYGMRYYLIGKTEANKFISLQVNQEGYQRHENSAGFSYYEKVFLGSTFRAPNDPKHSVRSTSYMTYSVFLILSLVLFFRNSY